MAVEIVIPSVGESVQEAILAEWFRQEGDAVTRDEPLLVIETDKVTLEVVAESDGVLHILVESGETVAIGAVVGTIEAGGARSAGPAPPVKEPAPEVAALPQEKAPPSSDSPPPAAAVPQEVSVEDAEGPLRAPPSVRRLAAEKKIDLALVRGTGPGGRISKGDVLLYLEQAPAGIPEKAASVRAPGTTVEAPVPLEERRPMSPIRKRIAERLLDARRNTAMLTTFNEIDMSRAMSVRSTYKEAFAEKHGVPLGFMSFFIKACVQALQEIPEINAFIDGGDVIYHHYQHIGVAIGSQRGLVVPVIRHAERMGFADVEQAIVDYVQKIRDNRLELADLEGGTFTVSNGGVYGSLMSTPILNSPQSGILGMHKIEKRPVVVDDEIVVRPMMYVALSYDHRIVDGKGAVTFLKRVKEFVENPERLVLEV